MKNGNHMKLRSALLFTSFFYIASLNAQTHPSAPSSSDAILKEAFATAKKEGKNVFVIFHASWCGWCREMDSSMNDIACKIFFDDNYVIRHLVVLESKNKKNLENPGATELLSKYKGEEQGIPFWLIFDQDGKLLADSQIRPAGAGPNSPGTNCGYPASEEETEFFIGIKKKTSRLNDQQLSIIKKTFQRNVN